MWEPGPSPFVTAITRSSAREIHSRRRTLRAQKGHRRDRRTCHVFVVIIFFFVFPSFSGRFFRHRKKVIVFFFFRFHPWPRFRAAGPYRMAEKKTQIDSPIRTCASAESVERSAVTAVYMSTTAVRMSPHPGQARRDFPFVFCLVVDKCRRRICVRVKTGTNESNGGNPERLSVGKTELDEL